MNHLSQSKIRNPKLEFRNKPGQNKSQIRKIQNEDSDQDCLEHCICFWSFEFVSDFVLRIFSNLLSLTGPAPGGLQFGFGLDKSLIVQRSILPKKISELSGKPR